MRATVALNGLMSVVLHDGDVCTKINLAWYSTININSNKAGLVEGSLFKVKSQTDDSPLPPFIFQEKLI